MSLWFVIANMYWHSIKLTEIVMILLQGFSKHYIIWISRCHLSQCSCFSIISIILILNDIQQMYYIFVNDDMSDMYINCPLSTGDTSVLWGASHGMFSLVLHDCPSHRDHRLWAKITIRGGCKADYNNPHKDKKVSYIQIVLHLSIQCKIKQNRKQI